jgi:hypothetical protein
MVTTERPAAERLVALSTSGVSDALDRLAITGQALGIAPIDRSFRLAGRAWTLRYGPVGQDRGTVGDYIDDLGPGDVVVLDNQGRLDATVWGEPADDHRAPPRRRRHRDRRGLPRRRPQHRPRLPDLLPRQLDAHRQGPRPGRGHPGPGVDRRRPGGARRPAARRRRRARRRAVRARRGGTRRRRGDRAGRERDPRRRRGRHVVARRAPRRRLPRPPAPRPPAGGPR